MCLKTFESNDLILSYFERSFGLFFKFVRYHGCTGLLYLILKVTRLDNRVILLVDLYSAESTSNWLSALFSDPNNFLKTRDVEVK